MTAVMLSALVPPVVVVNEELNNRCDAQCAVPLELQAASSTAI